MRIVVTTPTGNIGSKLSERLLEAGQDLVVVARDAAKVAALAERGAEVIVGSHADPEIMKLATQGADALFLVAPPNMVSEDLVSEYRNYAEAAAEAIRANKIDHVVHLSSVGAEKDGGTGPILGLHHNEKILAEVAENIVQLRPGYFMENTLWQAQSIQQAGSMFTSFQDDTPIPMIATADIAERAAELLTRSDWEGEKIVELQGPEDISYGQIAGILTEVLEKPVAHTTVSSEQLKESLAQMGASAHIGDLFVELAEGVESKHVAFQEPRGSETRTPTDYRQFAETVFKMVMTASA